MTPAIQSAFEPWSISAPVTLPCFLRHGSTCEVGRVYGVRFQNLISAWQLAAFIEWDVALWIALGSPLRALHHELLSIHMVDIFY